jgi:nitroimidazol reductase NimA-like FMN-containing flavoprotein (pyridoxamine 5'-phosphate oxidase superfamily)
MTTEREPATADPMMDGQSATTPWAVAHERLANPEPGRTSWLATVGPDGRPHLMPIIAFWIDGAFHFVVGEGTRKGRNLAADGRCAIATGSLTLPSLDVIVEGYAEPLDDEAAVGRIAEMFRDKNWPLEARGDKVYGPNAPTAGPPPYSIYRMVPSKAFGLPGMFGMEQSDPADLPKPTRYEFDGA